MSNEALTAEIESLKSRISDLEQKYDKNIKFGSPTVVKEYLDFDEEVIARIKKPDWRGQEPVEYFKFRPVIFDRQFKEEVVKTVREGLNNHWDHEVAINLFHSSAFTQLAQTINSAHILIDEQNKRISYLESETKKLREYMRRAGLDRVYLDSTIESEERKIEV
jgi:hypothetical protein